MVKYISTTLRTTLASVLVMLLKSIHGLQNATSPKTYHGIVRSGMKPDPYYRGAVLVNKGQFFGYNGIVYGCAIHHVTNEWICLVIFYKGGDLYAVPFEYLEKIKIDRIIT